MTTRFALLLHAITVRDWMTLIIFLAANWFLLCRYSLSRSPLSGRARVVALNFYDGFMLIVWLGWLILLSLMRFIQ